MNKTFEELNAEELDKVNAGARWCVITDGAYLLLNVDNMNESKAFRSEKELMDYIETVKKSNDSHDEFIISREVSEDEFFRGN